jgi:Protein-L-isoaspartate(D-aspartate) O-methyltransferase (PCMT)
MEAESQGSDRVQRSASLISNGATWRLVSPMQVEERTNELEVVKDYYGKLLKSSKDLKTPACCDGTELPPYLQPLLANVHPEVVAKYYGCGIVVPAELKGRRVLDLGSGSGRDTYILAQLAGPEGEVVGVASNSRRPSPIWSGIGCASAAGAAIVSDVRFKRSAKSERRKLLLTLATAPRQMGGPWKVLISRAG